MTRSSWRTAVRTVRAELARSRTSPSSSDVTRPRLIEPRLHTAVSSCDGDLEDLGAQVRQVHACGRAAPVWLHARLRRVLERHPAVAGLRQRAHHPRVELARLAPGCAARPCCLGRDVGPLELLAVQVGEVRAPSSGSNSSTSPSFSTRSHEQVGHPVGEVEVVRAARLVAGVVAQLEELLDVGVPRSRGRRSTRPCACRPG